ncbi:MAG: ABC transporter permease [Ignavibacteria bacterium]|nr:ABC transporter permease [Ignavibacteria bacterium]
MKIITIILNTFREAFSRKVFLFFAGVSTLVIIGFLIFFSLSSVEGIIKMMNLAEDKNALNKLVVGFQMVILGPLFAGGLFLAIFSTSSFIPNMLEKGTIDLLLSKPISRFELLLGKFLGGVFVVFINVAYLIGAIWLLTGIKFGIWNLGFLYSIFFITFIFAVLYVLMILIGTLTQSSILAMILCYLIFFVLSPILSTHEMITTQLITSNLGKTIIEVLYYIIPQTSELSSITVKVASGQAVTNWLPLLTTTLWGVAVYFIADYFFKKKSF